MLLGVVLLAGTTELLQFGFKSYRKHHLTPDAEAIFQITGVRIYCPEPLEEDYFREQLVSIAKILSDSEYQQADLSAICLANQRPWWTVSGWFKRVFFPQDLSSYFAGEITIRYPISAEDFCHELQHARLHRLPDCSGFRQAWISCNRQPYNASPLLLRGLLTERTRSPVVIEQRAQQDGFWSDYSRVGFEEDVAELVGTAIASPLDVMPLLTNRVLSSKIAVAIRYQLLSQDWLDFAPVATAWHQSNWREMPDLADAFLSRHPQGRFAVDALHFKAAALLRQQQQEPAAQIHRAIVNTPNIQSFQLYRALQQLAQIAGDSGDERVARDCLIAANANREFIGRHPASILVKADPSHKLPSRRVAAQQTTNPADAQANRGQALSSLAQSPN